MTEDRIFIYEVPAPEVKPFQYEETDAKKATPCWTFEFSRTLGIGHRDLPVSPSQLQSGYIYFTNGTTLYIINFPDDGSADFELVDSWTWDTGVSTEFILGARRGIRWPAEYAARNIGCLSYAILGPKTARAMPKLPGRTLCRVTIQKWRTSGNGPGRVSTNSLGGW